MGFRYRDYNSAVVSANNAVEAIFKTNVSGDAVSLAGWRERCRRVNSILCDLKMQNRENIARLSETYADKVVQERKAEQDAKFFKVKEAAGRLIERDFDLVMQAKREQYERAHDGPDDSTFRLLSTLSMRTNVSASELVEATRKCSNNVQALRLLGDIAKRNGLMFPDIEDDEEFEKAVEIAEGWRELAKQDVDMEPAKMGYMQRIFWTTSDLSGQFGQASAVIDSPRYLDAGDSDLAQYIQTIDADINKKTAEGASKPRFDSPAVKMAMAKAVSDREKAERDAAPLPPSGLNIKRM